MIHKDHIQKEVDRTLESLDGVQRAASNPYLFTRIKARMEKGNGGLERITSFITRPAVALAILFSVMAINAAVILSSDSADPGTGTENMAITSGIAEEYNISFATIYDLENPVINTSDK